MNEYYIKKNENGISGKTEIDLSLYDEAPQKKRSWLLWVFVKIGSPSEIGWCVQPECATLAAVQNDLTEALAKEIDAVASGTRMEEGWLELYFYAPNAKRFDNVAASVMRRYEGYAFETGASRDEKWDHYSNELYPDPLMLQQMQNRYIIGELQDAGDDITVEREVEHYLLFQTDAHAKRVLVKLEAAGYTFKEYVQAKGEYSHGVVVVKVHDVTEATMMLITEELLDTAYDEYGIYEGWSTVLAAEK